MSRTGNNKRKPVRIIGGGVAGLFLGLRLRQVGVKTTVVESGHYPRHRVCGEFMAGAGETYLRRAGLGFDSPAFPRHRATRWFAGGKEILRRTLPRPALGVSRHILDQSLADAFRAAGGNLVEGVRERENGADPPGTVRATGRRASPSPWIGLKGHYTGLTAEGLAVHLGHRAYVGVAPVEGGRVNVCGLFRKRPGVSARREEALPAYLRVSGLVELSESLGGAVLDPASVCGVAAFQFSPAFSACGDAVYLGDRLGVIPPFTGDGMSLALESAECAVPHIAAYAHGTATWSETAVRVRAAHTAQFRHRFRWARRLHPFLLHPAGASVLRFAAAAGLLPFTLLYRRTHAPLPPCTLKA
ncbi:MAG: hypothetical protein JJU00_14030 [Opitutales bacterium]|nr:hypothetical protein [Opitutales bacterium]